MNEDKILAIVKTILKNKGDDNPIGPEDSLVYSGRLRSMNIIELASQLETEFGIDFSEQAFNQYDFDTITTILKRLKLP